MSRAAIDTEQWRVALRRMNRGSLLIVAERAIEIVPRAKLRQLVGDMVRIEELAEGKPGSASLLDEVKKFHAASLRHEYYDSFDVNSKNYMEKSNGTEAFIAECGRLIGKCVRAAAKDPRRPLREAFELLFALLRRIDEDSDSVVLFADEGARGRWASSLSCAAPSGSGHSVTRWRRQRPSDLWVCMARWGWLARGGQVSAARNNRSAASKFSMRTPNRWDRNECPRSCRADPAAAITFAWGCSWTASRSSACASSCRSLAASTTAQCCKRADSRPPAVRQHLALVFGCGSFGTERTGSDSDRLRTRAQDEALEYAPMPTKGTTAIRRPAGSGLEVANRASVRGPTAAQRTSDRASGRS